MLKRINQVWKQLTTGSTNRQIMGAIAIIGIGTGLVKIITLVKDLFVAWEFGTGDDLDAFLVAFIVPSFIVSIVSSSFNAALIPTYIQVREREGKKTAQKLFSGVVFWSTGLLVIATILVVALAPVYLPWIAKGFSAEKLDLTFKLFYITAPFILFSGISTTWSAILNAGERFALVAIAPMMIPIVTIAFLVLFHSLGIFNLAFGTVVGTLLELIFLGFLVHYQNIPLLPKWYKFDVYLRQVANQSLPTTAGAFLMNSANLVDQSMAAMLSPGSVAALNYGNRIIGFVLVLTTTAISSAVIPYFSKMVACSDWKGINHTLKRYLGLIFVITIPMAFCLYFFSEPIIQTIYQRGAFGSQETNLVAKIQGFFALQIPFYLANIVVVRIISALCLNKILVWVSLINIMANIALNIIFVKVLGAAGIALSTSCVYFICFCITFTYCISSIKRLKTV